MESEKGGVTVIWAFDRTWKLDLWIQNVGWIHQDYRVYEKLELNSQVLFQRRKSNIQALVSGNHPTFNDIICKFLSDILNNIKHF